MVLVYFDPFAGLPWYEPVNEKVAARVEKLRETALGSAQHDIPKRYYGSSFVVKNCGEVFGTETEVLVNDRDEAHLTQLRKADLKIINEEWFNNADGFSILKKIPKLIPDLLLLDPYADFLPRRAKEVIPKLSSFSDSTTIVLFVLIDPDNNAGQRYRPLIQRYCAGGWLAKCPPLVNTSIRGESKYCIELVIIPAPTLPKEISFALLLEFCRYCQKLSAILDVKVVVEAIMPGRYCRGCGKYFAPPQHPKQCLCGPLGRKRRRYCEFCGEPVNPASITTCQHCCLQAGFP